MLGELNCFCSFWRGSFERAINLHGEEIIAADADVP
jgi:hypothetical protein